MGAESSPKETPNRLCLGSLFFKHICRCLVEQMPPPGSVPPPPRLTPHTQPLYHQIFPTIAPCSSGTLAADSASPLWEPNAPSYS